MQLLQISCADVGYVHDYFFWFNTWMHTRNHDQSFYLFSKEHCLGDLIIIEVHMVPSYYSELPNF